MIELKAVCKEYDGRRVLDDFSLTIADGERVCLRGVSGCGKTTVLRLLAGLEQPDRGEVIISGQPRLSAVFQENRLLPWKSALDNITLIGAERETALDYLERLGLAGEEHKLPGELSGGMRRRVAIARALANPGELFLLDEPIQGLDDGTAGRVLEVMAQALEGRTVVLVTHDNEEAAALAQRVVEMTPAEPVSR